MELEEKLAVLQLGQRIRFFFFFFFFFFFLQTCMLKDSMIFHCFIIVQDYYWFLSYKQTKVKPLQQIEYYLLAVFFLSDIGKTCLLYPL